LEEEFVKTIKEICEGIEKRYSMDFETIGFD
jgi:hypothetical protein